MVVRPSRIAGLAAALGCLAFANTARADDNELVEVLEGVGAAAAVIGDIVFTSYDIGTAANNKQPDKGWMIAQTAFAVPQTLGTYIFIVADIQDPKFESRAPLLLPITVAASSLTTHAIWSLATDRFPPGPRLGASWLMGTNFTFTAISVSETVSGKLVPKPIALAEALIMTPEAVVAAVAAVKDPAGRGGWIGIAGWSGVLAVHGVVSLLAGLANVQPPIKPVTGNPPPPPPEPEPEPEPRAPGREAPPSENAPPAPPPAPAPLAPPLAAPSPQNGLHAMIIPAAITDGVGVVPGALVVGVF